MLCDNGDDGDDNVDNDSNNSRKTLVLQYDFPLSRDASNEIFDEFTTLSIVGGAAEEKQTNSMLFIRAFFRLSDNRWKQKRKQFILLCIYIYLMHIGSRLLRF